MLLFQLEANVYQFVALLEVLCAIVSPQRVSLLAATGLKRRLSLLPVCGGSREKVVLCRLIGHDLVTLQRLVITRLHISINCPGWHLKALDASIHASLVDSVVARERLAIYA